MEYEKHDIDLTVKTPKGIIYDFKNRKVVGEPGELVLDSRYGPGAEIWMSKEVIPGIYEVELTLYNQYGNQSDAVVSAEVIVGVKKLVLKESKLNASKRSAKFKFKISPVLGHYPLRSFSLALWFRFV